MRAAKFNIDVFNFLVDMYAPKNKHISRAQVCTPEVKVASLSPQQSFYITMTTFRRLLSPSIIKMIPQTRHPARFNESTSIIC